MNARTDPTLMQLLASGNEALQRGDWHAAREHFARAVEHEETPQGLEGLGMSLWWLHDVSMLFDVRERAYRLYRDDHDEQSAARMAIYIALDYYLFRGEHALVNGWFGTARRLLERLDLCPEHAVMLVWEGYVVLMSDNDVEAAGRLSSRAVELAHELGVTDFEILARALNGLSMVSAGNITQGMQLLDEAAIAATSGDMTDLDAIATTWCFLIYACERVRDFDRAVQWCDKVRSFSEQWDYQFMFSFCQVHYASVLVWHGDWPAAETELLGAARDLSMTQAAMAGEALVRLAGLRRKQGRMAEAEDLFLRADQHPMHMSAGTAVLLGKAELALDRDDPALAVDLAERYLRRVHAEDKLERIGGLDVLARAQANLGRREQAAETLDMLLSISSTVDCQPLEASSRFCAGIVAAATGDPESARRCLEDAADLFSQRGAPYEAAVARIELAGVLRALGRHDVAAQEASVALTACREIGAAGAEARAGELLQALKAPQHHSPEQPEIRLTPRETEVLELIAQGMTDREISLELQLSEHTIHRHVANILTRLDVPSRTAAVALAARSRLI